MPDTPSALEISQSLIRHASVTPDEAGALTYLDRLLAPFGFTVHRLTFTDQNTPDVENIFAKISGGQGPHLMFAGHVDVVPAGDESLWRLPPFAGEIADGKLYGRGAADMKGGVGAFCAAALRYLAVHGAPEGALSLVLTCDEEGPAVNGTTKIMQWAKEEGEIFDAAILGEPSNPDQMGEEIKIGRRGSQSGRLIVTGQEGHVAYPHLARNPVPVLAHLVAAIDEMDLDHGTDFFQPSNLEFIGFETDNAAWNVIPTQAAARFNCRFNPLWDGSKLAAFLEEKARKLLPEDQAFDVKVTLEPHASNAFFTRSEELVEPFKQVVETITGRAPACTTGGGTSDARFIINYCPVIEFGLVNKTIHQIDEHVAVDDLAQLEEIYFRFLEAYFSDEK